MPTSMTDPFDLARFVDAQAASYVTALAEIRRGRKQSHWMWFIFPQFYGLGSSAMAKHYAIRSHDEGAAYLAHSLLGTRYRECVNTLQDLNEADPETVFGQVDAHKLRSSLTLFNAVTPELLFTAALDRWFDGLPDERTVQLLSS